MTLLLIVTAFAVDLGVQRVLRRDLQAIADLVALDMARGLDGRTQAVIKATNDWRGQLQVSLERNLNETPAPVVTVQQKQEDAVATVAGSDLVVTATMGLIDPATGLFSNIPYPEVPTAVRVTAASSVDFAFAGVVGIDSGAAIRSAVGATQKSACFKMGSYAAAIRSGKGSLLAPLKTLLGFDLDLLSYQGLAGGTVSLDQIVATGLVGTPEQFLSSTTTLATLQAATLTALNNQRPKNAAAVSALNALISATANQSAPVKVGNVVNVGPTDAAALGAGLNVLDLLTGAALVANGTNAIAVSGLTAGTATVGGVTVNTLAVTERPSLACGTVETAPTIGSCAAAVATPAALLPRGCAQNSQLRGTATIPLTLQNVPLADTVFKVSSTGSVLSLNLGNAAGVLTVPEPSCAAGTLESPDTFSVKLATSAATASLTTNLALETNPIPLELPSIPPVPAVSLGSFVVSANVNLVTSIPPPTATGQADLLVPPNDTEPAPGSSDVKLSSIDAVPTVTLTIRYASGGLVTGALLGTVTGLLNTVLGITASTVTQALGTVVDGVVNPLIASVNGTLLQPLSTLLGLNVAGADVYAVGRPTCQTPRLVG